MNKVHFGVVKEQERPSGAISPMTERSGDRRFLGQRTLTPRERDVIGLIGRGLLNKQIAYELKIAESTVVTHIKTIKRKYGLRNRTQIALMFTTKNELSPDHGGGSS
jgi:DNA-binding NarL/FixJ family response regulator